MTANGFRDHCRTVAHRVDWENTCDRSMHGDPATEVKGIAVTSLATNPVLREAVRSGLNLVIAPEGAFRPAYEKTALGQRRPAEKRQLLDELGLALMRCHDTWDRLPEVGISEAWSAWLGFALEP